MKLVKVAMSRRNELRRFDLAELKKMLGIDTGAYPKYPIFARDGLKKCQKALATYTDIKFEFNAVGRPAKAVHFMIWENKIYTPPAFIAPEVAPALPVAEQEEDKLKEQLLELMKPFHEACKNEFNKYQMRVLVDELIDYMPDATLDMMADALRRAYHELELKSSGQVIKNRYTYLKGIIKNMLKPPL